VAGGSDEPHLVFLLEVGHSLMEVFVFERFDGRRPLDHQAVDVVGLEALQAMPDFFLDLLLGADVLHPNLRGDEEGFSFSPFDRFPGAFFRRGPAIPLGRVDVIDSRVQHGPHNGGGIHRRRPDPDIRHLKAGAPQHPVSFDFGKFRPGILSGRRGPRDEERSRPR